MSEPALHMSAGTPAALRGGAGVPARAATVAILEAELEDADAQVAALATAYSTAQVRAEQLRSRIALLSAGTQETRETA